MRDEHTIAWADFRGNLQHVSTGNLAGDHRAAIIAVDYPRRQRLKLFGMARVVRIEDDPSFVQSLTIDGYDAVVEAAITFTVSAFDWNCPQHIPRRFTLDQIEEQLSATARPHHATRSRERRPPPCILRMTSDAGSQYRPPPAVKRKDLK